MKLDRNIHSDGKGKYALIKLREFDPRYDGENRDARSAGEGSGMPWLADPQSVPLDVIDFGDKPETEFFVIRLKDKYAAPALQAYAMAAEQDDPEYAEEIRGLAQRAQGRVRACRTGPESR